MMARTDPLHAGHDGPTLRRKTIHGAGATAVAQVLKFVLQFGAQVVLARLLDPAQFGLIAMVAPVLGFVIALNDFGLGQAIVQRSDITHRQVTALFWLNLVIGIGFTLLAMAGAPLLAGLYGEPRTLSITLASASLIILSSLSVVPMSLLNRQMRFVTLAAIEVTAMAAGLATGIVLAWKGFGFWSLVIMQAINSLVSTSLSWLCCGWLPGAPRREPGVGSLMRFGANVMGSNIASYLSMSADNVIVGVVNGKVALGLYDRSYNLVVKPLWQLMAPTSRVAIPLLSRLQDAPDRYARAYMTMLQLTTVLCVPGLIATMIVAPSLIVLILGAKWVAMVPIFRWICFGGLAAGLSSSASWLFMTQNRTDEQMRFSTLMALLSLASFGLGSIWGAVGVAAVAALSFMLLQTPLALWAATRKGPVTGTMLLGGMGSILAATIICGGVMMAISEALGADSLPRIAMTFVLCYAVFVLALVAQPAGRDLFSRARSMMTAPREAAA